MGRVKSTHWTQVHRQPAASGGEGSGHRTHHLTGPLRTHTIPRTTDIQQTARTGARPGRIGKAVRIRRGSATVSGIWCRGPLPRLRMARVRRTKSTREPGDLPDTGGYRSPQQRGSLGRRAPVPAGAKATPPAENRRRCFLVEGPWIRHPARLPPSRRRFSTGGGILSSRAVDSRGVAGLAERRTSQHSGRPRRLHSVVRVRARPRRLRAHRAVGHRADQASQNSGGERRSAPRWELPGRPCRGCSATRWQTPES